MSYRRHVDGLHNVYWPAFVDIFVVLLAVSLLALPPREPPPPKKPPPPPPPKPTSIITPMRPEQFRAKRLLCRLGLAVRELTVPNVEISGDGIRIKVPGTLVETDLNLPKESKKLADEIKDNVFDSGLQSHWSKDPVSISITGVAVEFYSSADEYDASAVYARRLSGYLRDSLAGVKEPVRVTWSGTVYGSGVRSQVFITVHTSLTDRARAQAEDDRQDGMEPCPSSPKL